MEELEMLSEVARLYYENNMTQSEIAKQIHTSRSTVSRLLIEAREKKVVEITIHYPWDRSPDLERQFLAKFGLKDVRILQTRGRHGEEALKGVALLAARYLDSVVKDDTILGVSWGRTVHNTVELLKPARKIPIKVVQLFGAAIPNNQIDGFDVVRRTAAIYGGECYYIHAPLFVGSAEARDALLESPHIKETLRLAEKATVVLTGIGSLEPSLSPSQTWVSYLSRQEIAELKNKGAAGHINAHHFDLAGNVLPIKLHEGIVGVGVESLKKVPVVIAVASGIEKARAILGALNGKLINTLITDDCAAEKVLEMAQK
jgi:deoxyribonucleoside regulator